MLDRSKTSDTDGQTALLRIVIGSRRRRVRVRGGVAIGIIVTVRVMPISAIVIPVIVLADTSCCRRTCRKHTMAGNLVIVV
jgi:hypothetical protein